MKKRLISYLTAVVFILALTPAALAAATGAAAGSYYYTDIVTYLWNVPINSINIGGRTLIDAESMAHYGFTVTWIADKRLLEIEDNITQKADYTAATGALNDMSSGRPGKAAGTYYHTDIVTTLNGQAIESYNIGGRTFISAEGMRDFGYTVDWDGVGRQLFISAASGTHTPWTISIYEGGETTAAAEAASFDLVYQQDFTGQGNFVLYGSGFPALSHINLSRDRLGAVSLSFSIYQYTKAKLSDALLTQIFSNVSYYGSYIKEPSAVYDALNKLMRVYINGQRVMISELQEGRGNGHVDFSLALDTDSSLEAGGVYSIVLLCNVPEDFDISTLPPVTAGLSPYEAALISIRSKTYFSADWEAETDACMIINGGQSGLPHPFHTLAVIYKANGKIVRPLSKTGVTFEGGLYPRAYDLSLSEDETTLFFSFDYAGVSYSYQMDLASEVVTRMA